MLILHLLCSVALAEVVQVPIVEYKTYVYDNEELLTTDQEETLNSVLRYLEEKTSIEFAVVTVSSYSGISIEDYANRMFNSLGLGKKDKDNGILLLVSKDEGHARLEIGYGLESLLTDGICGRILDSFYVPNRDNGNHANSVIKTANGVLAIIGKEYNIDFVEDQESIVETIKKEDIVVSILKIVTCIILVIIMVYLQIHLNLSSRSKLFYVGSSSRGGGHFGGGLSGGGGASR
jgi:uncharacterized protein